MEDHSLDQSFPEEVSLLVFLEEQLIFSSDGKWLYPLFDFEDFLKTHAFDLNDIFLKDKVIGKASALLIIRMGIKKVHGDIMSELAMDVLDQNDIHYSYTTCVPKISCKTEELLHLVNDPEIAYQILCKRAKRC